MRHNVRPRMLAVATALMAALACGGGIDTTAPPGADAAVGVYTLSSINTPAVARDVQQSGNDKLEITGGGVTPQEDRTFSDVTTARLTIAGSVTSESDSGFRHLVASSQYGAVIHSGRLYGGQHDVGRSQSPHAVVPGLYAHLRQVERRTRRNALAARAAKRLALSRCQWRSAFPADSRADAETRVLHSS